MKLLYSRHVIPRISREISRDVTPRISPEISRDVTPRISREISRDVTPRVSSHISSHVTPRVSHSCAYISVLVAFLSSHLSPYLTTRERFRLPACLTCLNPKPQTSQILKPKFLTLILDI